MTLVNLQNQKHDQACMLKYLYEFTVIVFFFVSRRGLVLTGW